MAYLLRPRKCIAQNCENEKKEGLCVGCKPNALVKPNVILPAFETLYCPLDPALKFSSVKIQV